MYYCSDLHQVGLALGSGDYGTAAGSITRGLLVETCDIQPERKVEPAPDVRGDLSVRRTGAGGQDYKISLGAALDVGDSSGAGIGDILASVLGKDTGTSLGGSKYKHRLQLDATCAPPWFNIWTDILPTPKQLTGIRFGSFKISIDSSATMIKFTADGIGKEQSDLAAQTLSFASAPLLDPLAVSVFTLGGGTVINFDKADITITSELEAFRPLANSRLISQLFRKKFDIDVALSGLSFSDETERNKFLGSQTDTSLDLKILDANSDYLEFYFPAMRYKTFKDPGIARDDLLKMSLTSLVLGDPANWYVDIKNGYSKRYDTGASI